MSGDNGQPDKRAPNEIDHQIGRRVKSKRTQLGLTQEALADRLKITGQQLSRYETGSDRIGASRLFEIAEALSVPVAWFFLDGKDDVEALTRNALRIQLLAAFDEIEAPERTAELVEFACQLARNVRSRRDNS